MKTHIINNNDYYESESRMEKENCVKLAAALTVGSVLMALITIMIFCF